MAARNATGLKHGSFAASTIMRDRLWQEVDSEHYVYRNFHDRAHDLRITPGKLTLTPELFTQPMPAPRLAFEWGTESYLCTMFHSHAYIREIWVGSLMC